MSRSYRKVASYSTNSRGYKRFANKRVRREDSLYQNSEYKKVYDGWNINDFGSWAFGCDNYRK